MLTKIPDGSMDVIQILRTEELLTIDEIYQLLPSKDLSTVRYAIRRLLEVNILQSIPDLLDMRTVKYRLNTDGDLNEALDKLPPIIVNKIREGLNGSEVEETV